jgi:hypothetical protein
MWVRGELIFNRLVDFASYPWEFFNLRELVIFLTSLIDNNISLMFGKGLLILILLTWKIW